MSDTSFMVITRRIVGNPEAGYEECVYTDEERFSTRRQAIKHGWKKCDSDDFNVAEIDAHNRLVRIWWMDEHEQFAEDIPSTAERLGLACLETESAWSSTDRSNNETPRIHLPSRSQVEHPGRPPNSRPRVTYRLRNRDVDGLQGRRRGVGGCSAGGGWRGDRQGDWPQENTQKSCVI
jgi:hypothetical protein